MRKKTLIKRKANNVKGKRSRKKINRVKRSIHNKRVKHNDNKTYKNKSRKYKQKRGKYMKGGKSTLDAPPFVPPGGPYEVGSLKNGLGGGYYYKLANPEFHAPNGTAKDNMSGGGLIPRDLTYLYRSAGSGLKSLYNGFTGQVSSPSSNPNPMYQPEMSKNVTLDSSVPDINRIIEKANHEASL